MPLIGRESWTEGVRPQWGFQGREKTSKCNLNVQPSPSGPEGRGEISTEGEQRDEGGEGEEH